jgi:hypothetical protein
LVRRVFVREGKMWSFGVKGRWLGEVFEVG